MADGDPVPFSWVEDSEDQPYAPVRQKRKYTHKTIEFVGWGSKKLIEFLMYLGIDVSKQISLQDASDIVNRYVKERNLFHPSKKKKIICDDRLHSLFGKKMIKRIKIFDLLEAHYAENQDDSDDDLLYSSDENEKSTLGIYGIEKSEKKSNVKKKVRVIPKNSFAAMIPQNIKLIYLRRTLVQDLSKDPGSFEKKVVGSVVRIKSDPNDYLQKNNSHLLVQITAVKKDTSSSDVNTELLLQTSYAIGDVRICKLSDVNFSEDECEDLHQRVKAGLHKGMTVGELEQKAQILHEDITKHWLARELALLKVLIDRANEKGWRKEMFEHMERRNLLRTPSKQAELLQEVPEVVPEDIPEESETEAIPQESSSNEAEDLADIMTQMSSTSHKSSFLVARVLSTSPRVRSVTLASQTSARTNYAEVDAAPDMIHVTEGCSAISSNSILHMEVSEEDTVENRLVAMEKNLDDIQNYIQDNQQRKPAAAPQNQGTKGFLLPNLNIPPTVIEISDDDEDEGFVAVHNVPFDGKGPVAVHSDIDDLKCVIWHYLDPRRNIQGPFSVTQLKEWFDDDYFPLDFKVWKIGQSQEEAVCLTDVLMKMFPKVY